NDDVLAELGRELLTLLVQLLFRTRAFTLDRLEHLAREGEELSVVGDRLRLTADGNDHAPLGVLGDAVADLALGRLTAGPLRRARHSSLAEQFLRGLEVAVRVLQRPLAVHHPRAGQVAELLDQGGGDLGHAPSPSGCALATVAASGSGSGSGAGAWASGSDCPPAGPRAPSAGSAPASAAGSSIAISCGVTFALPASIASAITRITSEHERIAS